MSQSRGTEIYLEEGENIENALKRFRRKVQEHKILSDVKRKVRHTGKERKETKKGSKKTKNR